MLRWRLSDEPVTEQEKDVDGKVDLEARKQVRRAADVQWQLQCGGSDGVCSGQVHHILGLHVKHHQQVAGHA